ncbi:carboxyvinyl-carboxyphosphonate phosphorylmutase [Halomonas daqingensis]|uniref:Carboxyvinyl-carboxyphosphonate phosphorylmutase n=1 Tax=Billgrantia desiderata TaxID=52021 RepID=A0AAW4YX61_9GAMM|nr:isocitrate lyase/phosphoenolpyruvate mutase family protein [Halomonas desiderata]MCE8028972.1 carboxyvinyl-carboxyphosphonate phosphorylmutase [Halomonas desiderata]MCE8053362.1 carboxyvinyl-carboxyphosphonate phosphorylmutase [Halomonas desiderata]NIC37007.1 carboxyvinyl-carboxyphosphonate phosphorylmutase [Halomonas desiderata]OUE46602.1 carboxyvinyl-carboxyphosphonate phosphorylmutase [Halomonas desiderata SP1]
MILDASDLKARLHAPEIVVAPGVYDALSASLAAEAGFDTVYLSGASIAYTQLGRPDIGLVSVSEVNDVMSHIRERTELSVVVDCDTGFGNAMNVMRSVRMLERAGANAIQLEDQTYPKRCGHLRGKTLVPEGEMVGKLKAALDARASDATLIIGRTDAVAVEGTARAIERAHAYREAGVDMLFIEGIRSDDDIASIMAEFRGRIPIMANMVEGGDTPLQNARALQEQGFSLVIFPGALVRAFTHMASQFFATLRRDGTTDAFRERMLDFGQLNEVLGTRKMLELGEKYDAR